MNEFVIQTKNLSKKYKNQLVVDSMSMSVKKGDIYGLIGKNGAGKTTFIRMLMGLVHPTSGEITLWDKCAEVDLREGRQRIGSIIEKPAFYPTMTARQNLELVRLKRGIPGKECISRCLKQVELEHASNKKAGAFSLGMKQRLGIAMALLPEPEMLILDEPINGLDPIGIVEIRELLKNLNRQKGITILISSHILSELCQMATCYGIMNNGKLIEELSDDELSKKNKQYLKISVDDCSKAVAIIETVLETRNYEVLPAGEIHLYDYVDDSAMVNTRLTMNKVCVKSIVPIGEDLESYFLKIAAQKTI